MSNWADASYLDYVGNGLTDADTPEAAFGIRDGKPLPGTQTMTFALTLPRATDPTELLEADWATRQRILAALSAAGTLDTTFGADQAAYQSLVGELTVRGVRVLDAADGYVSSAASRTVWVTMTAAQFAAAFGVTLMRGTQTIPDGASSSGKVTYWDGTLQPNFATTLDGMWIQGGAVPTPVVDGATAVTLPDGPLGTGNAHAAPARTTALFPNQVAETYSFPLAGSALATPPIGLIENNVGGNVGDGDINSLLAAYRLAAGVTGSGRVIKGQVEAATSPTTQSERALDVGVAGTAAPYSNLVLYAGDGGTYSTLQEAIWDSGTMLGALSSSFSDPQRSSPDSPFYAAYQGLLIDAVLRNISVFLSAGDGGSSEKIGTGVPMSDISHDSAYAIVVGGTSLSSLGQALTDPSVSAFASLAQQGDPATLRRLVAAGLTTMPSAAAPAATFLETTWNGYVYTAATNSTNGFTMNKAGAGGIDTNQTEPGYQTAYGIDIAGLSYTGAQTGRGIPDVAALSGGNSDYQAPNSDMTYTANNHQLGTSAAAPLWASLAVQIQAVFADQGLPATGYWNDLLYTAAAVVPAAFNDITLGNNTSSFVYGGSVLDDGVAITPTGLGYSAGPGYDLTTGLGSPNGTVLARALTQIAQAALYSGAPALTDGTGFVATAGGILLVQPHLAAAANVTVGGISVAASAANSLAWSSQLAGQVVQPHFDPALVTAFDGYAQAPPAEMHVGTGQSLDVGIGGQTADPSRIALTSPYGFADFADDDGDVTLARPVAIAQTALGADGQDAFVRLRQDGQDPTQLTFYRVDDLDGTIDGIEPGQPGYAAAAFSRAYQTTGGISNIALPGFGNQSEVTLTGIDAGDIIAPVLTNGGNRFWAFNAANETVNGAQVTHLYNYGLDTWGFEDTYGGGDQDFNDAVFQIDFTGAAGHALLAGK